MSRDRDRRSSSRDMREIPEGEYARLWIGGLESTVTEEDLRKKFETVGRLVDVKIRSARSLSSRSGRSVHIFGYVEYETRELAKEAMEKFDQDRVGTSTIKVTWAQRKGSRQHLDSRNRRLARLRSPSPRGRHGSGRGGRRDSRSPRRSYRRSRYSPSPRRRGRYSPSPRRYRRSPPRYRRSPPTRRRSPPRRSRSTSRRRRSYSNEDEKKGSRSRSNSRGSETSKKPPAGVHEKRKVRSFSRD